MPRKNAHRNGWKTKQSNTKNKKRVKLALYVIAFLILLLVFAQLVRVFNALSSPWGGLSIPKSSFKQDSGYSVNLVIKSGSDLGFLSFNPTDKKISLIKIPQQLLVNVPGGFGEWQIRSVFELGEGEKSGYGYELLKSSVSSLFSLPVDGVLEFKNGKPEVLVENFRTSMDIPSILSNLKSSLSLYNLLKLKFALSGVRFDKVSISNLSDTAIVESNKLADGTKVFVADPVRVKSISEKFADPALKEEYKSIAVYNATNTSLLAQNAADIISNLGANVIIVSSSDKKTKKSYILGNPNSKTFKRLLEIFDKGCTNSKNCAKISAYDLGSGSSRADITLVLGEDYH